MAQIILTDDDKRILHYIQQGHDIMAELFDLSGWKGERINECIEKLDENRYIERDALHGAGFWSFRITAKGTAALPPLAPEDARMSELGLCKRDLDMLHICRKAGKGRATEIIAGTKAEESMQINYAGSVVKLIRRGYMKESGFLKRIIELSPEGETLIERFKENTK